MFDDHRDSEVQKGRSMNDIPPNCRQPRLLALLQTAA